VRGRVAAVAMVALAVGPGALAVAVPGADTTRPKVLSGAAGQETYVLSPGLDGRVSFTVHATDRVGVAGVVVNLFAPGDDLNPAIEHPTELVDGTPQDGTWEAAFNVRLPMPAGVWTLRAFALDEAGNVSGPAFRLPSALDTFWVKREVRLKGPRAALAPGRSDVVVVRTRLEAATAERWAGLEKRIVRAEFRREGRSRWVDKGPLVVHGSTYRKWFRHTRDGHWRIRYDGTDKLTPAYGPETYVDVG
jgi:hypothetical protein